MSEVNRPLLKNLWAREGGAHRVPRPVCRGLDSQHEESAWSELQMHTDAQHINCAEWHRLNELIDDAIRDGREEFSPGPEMTPAQWAQIATLPPTIALLKSVKHLNLYGSSLVRIPPEIGEMTALERFSPYTSYRLHWLPYEITRCKKLTDSTISTRALYGNFKHRSPFPRLPQINAAYLPERCSVCDASLTTATLKQRWISLRVATDVVPLLVHACSDGCISALPAPPEGYVGHPHVGGLDLVQPEAIWY
jgi:hypothetical protein